MDQLSKSRPADAAGLAPGVAVVTGAPDARPNAGIEGIEQTREFSALFDPGRHLPGVIDQALTARAPVAITTPEDGRILIAPASRRYAITLPVSNAAMRAEHGSYAMEASSDETACDEPDWGRPVAELLWNAALHASHGRLAIGIGMTDVLRLRCWPNLTRLSITPNCVRIMALLSRQPASISVLRGYLRAPREEIAQVLSAALCAGHLAFVNRNQVTEPEPEHAESGSLIGRLLRKLAPGRGAPA